MDSVATEPAKGPLARPSEPISPTRRPEVEEVSTPAATVSTPAPVSEPAPVGASSPAPTPIRAPESESLPKKPSSPVPLLPSSSSAALSAPTEPSAAATTLAPRSNLDSKSPPPPLLPPPPPPPTASPPPPTAAALTNGRAPSPLRNPLVAIETSRTSPVTAPVIAPVTVPDSATEAGVVPPSTTQPAPPKQVNGNGNSLKNGLEEGEPDSELSDPGSTVHSPSGVEFNELEDEIVVSSRANRARKQSSAKVISDHEDEVMADADEPAVSHYPKRKRTSIFNDLSESKIEVGKTVPADNAAPANAVKAKPPRQNLSSVKGVTLGYWRDSPAPEETGKHAVIGFIDVRDRLRTRIHPVTTSGEQIPSEYPLPPGPGGSWVTFERIVFSNHLVGLDHFQVKEYVRIRADAAVEETEAARKEAERDAVNVAIRRAKENAATDPSAAASNYAPLIAWGRDIPTVNHNGQLNRADAKRRKISGGFAGSNAATSNGTPQEQVSTSNTVLPTPPGRNSVDPLPGTRPTRILLGYWKLSGEVDVKNRHAVYGILGQNDMFRVKLVRETRDGRFVDGNFPVGAGALWIAYEEVEFESHLKPLTRVEIKEYCRVRQWQIDHGETPEERVANETKAVYEAQARMGTGYKNLSPATGSLPSIGTDDAEVNDTSPARLGAGGHELRQSRRAESRAERPIRQAPPADQESRPAVNNRVQGTDPLSRTSSLARREIERVEAAQGRADRHAENRERAATAARNAAAAAANAAAASSPTATTNGRSRFHESEEMQRLNKVWARQESLRMKAGAEDAKIYGGVKYERKANGPFMGKLVSQGTIISIDGEDFVEYRVLTKPSFF